MRLHHLFAPVLKLILLSGLATAQIPPAWWLERGATNANPQNDHAAVNQGQLKHFTQKAVEELNARIPGGAAGDLNTLVNGWTQEYQTGNHSAQNPLPADFHAMTIGQLKWIASKINNRLIYACYIDTLPAWLAISATDNQLANLGQLKTIFNFDLTAPPGQLPDWWQKFYFNGQTGIDPDDDPDNDGFTTMWEFVNGMSPVDDSGINGPHGDLDGDGILNKYDSRANDANIGVMTITITTPSNGSTVP